MSIANNTLRCDACAQELTQVGQWLRVRRVITHLATGETRLIIECERCVSRRAYQGTLEKLRRLGETTAQTPAPTPRPARRRSSAHS